MRVDHLYIIDFLLQQHLPCDEERNEQQGEYREFNNNEFLARVALVK